MEQKKTNDYLESEKIVYKRYNNYLNKTIYVKLEEGNRNYPPEIKRFDKLVLVGIYDHDKKQHLEFPFSYEDQRAMWREVLKVIVKPEVREELLQLWEEDIREYMETGAIHGAFLEANTK